MYCIGASVARFIEDPSMYQSWGHSMIVDPIGKIKKSCEQEPAILYEEIDLDYIDEVREMLPYQHQKRHDLYKVEAL